MGEINYKALYNIGYGLYAITSNDGKKDNGFICNTVCQISSEPAPKRILVGINKANYSHDIIKETGKLNVNCLAKETDFSIFKRFGFQSGRDTDKFAGFDGYKRTDNGLLILPEVSNSYFSLWSEQYIDMESHGLFVCRIVDAQVLSKAESMTYSYYQSDVKPKPEAKKSGWVCKICGYIHEGDDLPDDFICPVCKHPASDFEKLA